MALSQLRAALLRLSRRFFFICFALAILTVLGAFFFKNLAFARLVGLSSTISIAIWGCFVLVMRRVFVNAERLEDRAQDQSATYLISRLVFASLFKLICLSAAILLAAIAFDFDVPALLLGVSVTYLALFATAFTSNPALFKDDSSVVK